MLSVMGTSSVVTVVPLFAGRSPELKPFTDELWKLSGMQGAAKSACVAVCVPFSTVGRQIRSAACMYARENGK